MLPVKHTLTSDGFQLKWNVFPVGRKSDNHPRIIRGILFFADCTVPLLCASGLQHLFIFASKNIYLWNALEKSDREDEHHLQIPRNTFLEAS